MILWLFSMVGVLVGVMATGTSISDWEALILLGISLIGGGIYLRNRKRKHSSLK
jgi:LPXTG-motif cell wall-anchored protein